MFLRTGATVDTQSQRCNASVQGFWCVTYSHGIEAETFEQGHQSSPVDMGGIPFERADIEYGEFIFEKIRDAAGHVS